MLNWALNGTDASKVTARGNGNHTGNILNTGSTITDVINNIYDLEGNLWEWTMEAIKEDFGVRRGGYCDLNDSPASTYWCSPDNTGTGMGSRLTLYIN